MFKDSPNVEATDSISKNYIKINEMPSTFCYLINFIMDFGMARS